MKRIILLCLCFAVMTSLTGCLQEKQLLVSNARKEDICAYLKQYAGLNGYIITYANDQLGQYRVIVDQNTADAHYDTVSTYDSKEKKKETTSVFVPARTTTYYYIININQSSNSVIINPQCGDNSFNSSCSSYKVRNFVNYLRQLGYSVYEMDKPLNY